ncbi:MAG: flagellar hook-basal body protein [Thermoguttaceae bacterium]
MSYGYYVSAEGAISQEFKLRTIANNIANVDTPGFKRELALQEARYTERIDLGDDYPGSGTINDVSGGVITVGTATEFSTGKIESTGDKTDVAINGEGFFVVRDSVNGEILLTRAGNFGVTSDGRLVMQSGRGRFEVCDDAMQPIVIPNPTDPRWQINDDGSIQDGEGIFANIALARPNSADTGYRQMLKLGENTWRSLDGQTMIPANERNMKSMHLEKSAVNPSTEMIEMIVTSRAIETNIKMMQSQSDLTAGLISKVLSV